MIFVVAAALAMAAGWSLFGRSPASDLPPADPPGDDEALLKLVPAQFVVVGLVTTGPDAAEHAIVELAAIRTGRDAQVHDSFEALVRPAGRLPADLVQRTGIDEALLAARGIPLGEAVRRLRDFVGELPLVARDVAMVLSFVDRALAQEGLAPLTNAATCTLRLARDGEGEGLLDGAPADAPEHRALAECKRALMAYMASAITQGWH